MRLAEGWKVLVVNPKGEVVREVDIGEYDFDKQIARGDVMNQIQEATEYEVSDDKRRV